MKCLTERELDMFLAGIDRENHDSVQAHIAGCPRCSRLQLVLIQEQKDLEIELYAEALPDDFTEQIMNRLESIELDSNSFEAPKGLQPLQGLIATECSDNENGNDEALSNLSAEDLPKPYRLAHVHRRKWGKWRLAAVAMAILLVAGALAAASPVLAQLVRSLFKGDSVDIGLLNAQEFGLVQHPGIRVKNNGYTVRIDEAVADPTRVVVALQLFGPDGKHDRERLVLNGPNAITIKDEHGVKIDELYDMGMTNDFYYLVAFFPEPIQTDKITIEGRLSRLGNELEKIPFSTGTWNFDFSIDMKEAKAKTKVFPLQGEYITPDGMTIRLKRLTQMVQGVRLEMDTELSSDALLRSPDELWKQQGLKFHFETMEGEEIHSVNTRRFPHNDSLMTKSFIPGDKLGLMHWSYTFKYLPTDTPFRFVFDGYFIAENDGSKVDFNPRKLLEQPVEFHSMEDNLILRKFTIEPNRNPDVHREEGTLHISGMLFNEAMNNKWRIEDEQGYSYEVRGGGGYGFKDGFVEMSGGRPDEFYQFRTPEINIIPERLTLIRTVVDRVHTNVNWTVIMNH
ncbi:DUF4179 domain-containing protein [Paenibacillus sp. RC67]|uniref:DUF4179 domain-containing protein n=1 Tax=Paenibacillus sp. RC67 TaxID=3039392 RepID=UPI0024ACD583|nr:DUF4179 domain-containing protein [Paenibacillus sp. RC67]